MWARPFRAKMISIGDGRSHIYGFMNKYDFKDAEIRAAGAR